MSAPCGRRSRFGTCGLPKGHEHQPDAEPSQHAVHIGSDGTWFLWEVRNHRAYALGVRRLSES